MFQKYCPDFDIKIEVKIIENSKHMGANSHGKGSFLSQNDNKQIKGKLSFVLI